MDSLMTIRIRVIANQALAQYQAMERANASLAASTRAANAASNAGATGTNRSLNSIRSGLAATQNAASKFGSAFGSIFSSKMASQVQWVGRQLSYNFTLPLLAAGAAAGKWALETEAGIVRMTKVYGDSRPVFQQLSKTEIPALQRAFEALSNYFGVAQSEVANIGADWAQAGVSGLALAKSVKLTLETMVLGEMDAADATKALIATQAQYGLTIEELSRAMDVLNMAENQSAASMPDLLAAFQRAAGSARSAGVDINHLAAMVTSLVPAAGSAENAGNALKTIFSRLLSPTREAAEVMGMMGINVKDTGWQSLTAAQRLEVMSKKFVELDGAQKAVVSSVIASRWQINKFDVLMEDMANKTGRYATTLNAVASVQANFNQRQKELNAVLQSNPQKVKQVWTIIQNAMIDAIIPLIPHFINFMQAIASLIRSFTSLDPELQKFILWALVAVAAIGPVTRILGAMGNLLKVLLLPISLVGKGILGLAGVFASFIGWIIKLPVTIFKVVTGVVGGVGRLIVGIGRWFIGIPGLIVAGIVGLAIIFKDQLAQLWNNVVGWFKGLGSGFAKIGEGIAEAWHNIVAGIIKVFNMLPEGIRNALQAVVDLVSSAVHAVYELFSYLNPFAHHSPSLVEVVTWGMAAIRKEYASVGNVGAVFKKAAADLAAFKKAGQGLAPGQFKEARANVAKARPAAVPAFDRLEKSYNELSKLQSNYQAKINNQTAVVAAWKGKLDAANAALDKQQQAVDAAQKKLDGLTNAYDAAKNKISDFASAPLKGMAKMSDAIFANDLAQKKLQLRMMDYKKANPGIEDAADKFSKIQGVIENLQGRITELRGKGAGSEILGPLQKQMADLVNQQKKLGDGGGKNAYQKMQDELDKLSSAGERLDLLNSIKFDPLTRQIDKLANGQKELRYEDVIHGIKQQQAVMKQLTPQITAAQQAVNKQNKEYDRLKKIADAVNKSYDEQNAKLSNLKDQYDQITSAVNDIASALKDMGNAAADAIAKAEAGKKAGGDSAGNLTPGGQNFQDAAGGDWGDVGGNASLGREGGLGDQSLDIDKFTQDLAKKTGDLFNMGDMFAPIKKAWNATWAWIKANLGGPIGKVIDGIKQVWNGLVTWFATLDWKGGWDKAWGWLAPILKAIWDPIKKSWDAIWPSIKKAGEGLWDGLKAAFAAIWPSLQQLWKTLGPLVESSLPILKALLAGIGAIILFVVGALSGALGPAIEAVGKIIADVIDVIKGFVKILTGIFDTVSGFVELIVGLLTFDGDKIKAGWDKLVKGIGKIFSGIWDVIKGVLKGIWDAISGVAKTVWGALKGGFSAIIDGIKSFATGFYNKGKEILTKIWEGIKSVFGGLLRWFGDLPGNLLKGITNGATAIFNAGRWLLTHLWDGIKSVLSAIGSWFGGIASNVWTWISTNIAKVVTAGVDFVKSLISGFGKMLSNVGTWFANLPGAVWKWISTKAGSIVQAGGNFIKSFISGLGKLLGNIGSWFAALPGKVWNWVATKAGQIVTAGGNMVKSLVSGLGKLIGNIGNWFATIPGKVWSWIATKVQSIYNAGASFVTSLVTGLGRAIASIGSWFAGLPGKVWSWISEKVSDLWTAGTKLLGSVVTGIGKGIAAIGDWFRKLPGKIWAWISENAGDLWDAGGKLLKNILTGIGNAITDIYNWFAALPGKFVQWVLDLWNSFMAVGAKIGDAIWQGVKDSLSISYTGNGLIPNWGTLPKPGHSKGGLITGPGTGTSDSIPARLSNGEFVITAAKYKQFKKYVDAIHDGTISGMMDKSKAAGKVKYVDNFIPVKEEGPKRPMGFAPQAPQYVDNSTHSTVNFYGDIVLPNVTSGQDAHKLLEGLKQVARGPRR